VTAGVTTSNINFTLATGGRISGTVTNAGTSAPIQNVTAQIFTQAGVQLTGFNTNSSGFYITSGLPDGTYYVRTANQVGFINKLYNNLPCTLSCVATTGTPVIVTAAVNATTPGIDFALDAGGRISGTITNAATTFPIQGVNAQVHNSAGTSLGSAGTNASGLFTTSGLPAGTYYIRSNNALGFVDQLYSGLPCPIASCASTITSGTPIVVNVGAITGGVNFALSTGGRISGTVTSVPAGTPIAGVTAQIYTSGGTFLGSLNTGPVGNYITSGLPAGTYFARTSNGLGYANRLYNNLPCSGGCVVTTGTPITVTASATTTGVNFALTTLFTFTDNPLVANTTVAKAVHLIELRNYVSQLRSQMGLPLFPYTDLLIAGTTPIKAVHISELRTALNGVYDALVRAHPVYTDPVLQAGVTPVKAIHISELRAAVLAVQ
jgi:hypothetical protein